jgi:uncharacterized damage-inducible protein DinB
VITQLIHTLYNYNAWANSRILDTAALLTDDQFIASGSASFGSIRDTLVHTMSAQWLWLARWQGASPLTMLSSQVYPTLASIRARWEQIEDETRAFVSAVEDADLAGVVAYVNTQGQPWAYPLWQQMVHQVNHATQHRSEVATLLTGYGRSPGWLDLLYFVDVQGDKASADIR